MTGRRRAAAALAGLALATAALAAPAPARADDLPDYDPQSHAWYGLSSFVAVASGAGYEVAAQEALEWSDLDEGDILVVMYPLEHLDPQKLAGFLRAGGAALIADDFGDAKDAIAQLGLIRADVGQPHAETYWDNRAYAPIATELARHPITDGVDQVVCNHPAVLTHVAGAAPLVAFPGGDAVVVAGDRGPGRFVVVSDPSIFINRMLQFHGNLKLTTNLLAWLGRGHAHRIVLVRGDVPMYGEPKAFIYDANAGALGQIFGDINSKLDAAHWWLLTPAAMRTVAGVLAALLIGVALLAMPPWRRGKVDGAWLRFSRPPPGDEVGRAIALADAGGGNLAVAAAVLRDAVAGALASAVATPDALWALGRTELMDKLTAARGPAAATALARLYPRLRDLPSRFQAAAPYGNTHVSRHEFDRLYDDASALYRTLGEEPLP